MKTEPKRFVCVGAATQFYTKGKVYELVPKGDKPAFEANDGFLDETDKVISTFKPYTSNLYVVENKEKN